MIHRRAFLLLALLSGWTSVAEQEKTVPKLFPAEAACANFADDATTKPFWTLDDCHGVWARWTSLLPRNQEMYYMDRRVLQQIGDHFRQAGGECFVELPPVGDGVGSSSIRSIITWIFAVEVGCRWVVPNWGKRPTDASGRVKYCHAITTEDERKKMTGKERIDAEGEICQYVDWLQYFGFDKYSEPLPVDKTHRSIVLNPGKPSFNESLGDLRSEVWKIVSDRSGKFPWEYLLISFVDTNGSSRLFHSANNWDAHKLQITRQIIQTLKQTFYESQRQITFNTSQECASDKTRLNFGIHIRLGDRRQYLSTDAEYFRLLDVFMDTVTARVVDMGLLPPLFHVFSETARPCPSTETGKFEEFSAWPPVEEWQIESCWKSEAPSTCPEKEAGLIFTCRAPRSGVFRIQGRPLVLHLGRNVVNTLSCMIHGDGLLMGCSTFGQVAGILTEGISFFSMRCGGMLTPSQYQLVPPIALAESGRMWVPIDGSWRDPVLWSEDLLVAALRELARSKEAFPK